MDARSLQALATLLKPPEGKEEDEVMVHSLMISVGMLESLLGMLGGGGVGLESNQLDPGQ
jgi:hypothetical protein